MIDNKLLKLGFLFLVTTGIFTIVFGDCLNFSWLLILGIIELFSTGVIGGVVLIVLAFWASIYTWFEKIAKKIMED